MSLSRRSFIKVSTLAGSGLLFGFHNYMGNNTPFTFKPNLYIKIASDNKITFGIIKQELGQGIKTSLAMLLAEELEVNLATVKTEFISYDNTVPDYQNEWGLFATGGSGGVVVMWEVLRKAGATVRNVFLEAAAQTWNMEKEDCFARESFVHNRKDSRALSYGRLAEKASELTIPEVIQLKNPEDYKLIGKPVIDLKNKFVKKGGYSYGIDVNLPDMVYASIVLYPTRDAKLVRCDASKVLAIKGVSQILEFPTTTGDSVFKGSEAGLAIIANSTWTALKGKKVLEDNMEWDLGEYGDKDNETLKEDFKIALREDFGQRGGRGNIDTAFDQEVVKEITVSYENPYLAHGLMEPLNAIARVKDGKCEIWAGTQSPQFTSHYLSRILDLELENFVFHTYPSGGGFGRRFFVDYVTQAALISKKIGKTVKVTWTREDEIQHGRYHPFRQEHYRGGLDKDNNLIAAHYRGITTHAWGAGVNMIYNIPNYKSEYSIRGSVLHFGSWRSVGAHNSIFGRECFIDEMAHLAKKDPVAFRKELLQKELSEIEESGEHSRGAKVRKTQIPRYLNVLDILSEKVNWNSPLPDNEGLGLAISDYGYGSELTEWRTSICGQVAHISIKDNVWEVKKITAVVDCGTVVNPNGAKAQVEGSIYWALTPLIYEGIAIKNGQVIQSNFHDYKVLRIDGAPEIAIHFMESDAVPTGMGETAVPPLTPAVLNGIYAASGIRVRTIPVKELSYRYA
ncbi:xanthine dehydrogenase family protein molybdopterin-binding subunit [Ulvibacterium marinum]|uniref:xanthine dehydrogenase family protein molybdopterin-binding subunit n=1 Tax=Ulvibacterium marinum TaxID=2419782 RepID=UPI002494E32C|nr:molybdopterin cofactor-binding domain-containing protein [Ulvibacterium marinum]